MTHTLTLYRPSGSLATSYTVTKEVFTPTSKAPTKSPPKHLEIIIDRSGSMWGSMDGLRVMVSKVLALMEFHHVGMRVTLISYSSTNDCTVHFTRVPVEEVDHSLIQNIRVTGLTCMSQALQKALDLVDDKETTVIALHSDGFANDQSPWTEHQKIEKMLEGVQKPGLSIHTIAYSSYSDFAFLDAIATKGGGKSTFARNLPEVFTALEASLQTLKSSAGAAPAIARQGADLVVVFDPKTKRVLTSTDDQIYLHGIEPGATILRLTKTLGAQGTPLNTTETLAVARAFLGLGRISLAKQAVVSSKDKTLFPHLRAILPADLGAFALDLEAALFEGTSQHEFVDTPQVPTAGVSILEIMQAIRSHREHVSVHLPTLLTGYRRMSVKKIAGVRDESGAIIPPEYDLQRVDRDEWGPVGAVEVSTDHPNLNLRIDQPSVLIRRASGEVIPSVAGVKLAGKLFAYRNYTIVSDGRVMVATLRIKIASKAAWAALHELGVVPATYDPKAEVDIDLSSRNIINDAEGMPVLPSNLIEKWAAIRTLLSLIDAATKGSSTVFSSDQIAELKAVGLTPSLNFSAPEVPPYTDKAEAIAKGIIDSYVAYSITLGSQSGLLSMAQLKSANELLRRFFMVLRGGKEEKSSNLLMIQEENVTFEVKPLSSRAIATKADDIQRPLIQAFLGKEAFPEDDLLEDVLDEDDIQDISGAWLDMEETKRTAVLATIAGKLKDAQEAILKDYIQPLAFLVGSTGTFPNEDVPMLDADALEGALKVKLGKNEREGSFFLFGREVDKGVKGFVLSVYPKVREFTPSS